MSQFDGFVVFMAFISARGCEETNGGKKWEHRQVGFSNNIKIKKNKKEKSSTNLF